VIVIKYKYNICYHSCVAFRPEVLIWSFLCVECNSKETVDTSSTDFFGTERLNWFVNRAHLSKNYKQYRKLIHSFFIKPS